MTIDIDTTTPLLICSIGVSAHRRMRVTARAQDVRADRGTDSVELLDITAWEPSFAAFSEGEHWEETTLWLALPEEACDQFAAVTEFGPAREMSVKVRSGWDDNTRAWLGIQAGGKRADVSIPTWVLRRGLMHVHITRQASSTPASVLEALTRTGAAAVGNLHTQDNGGVMSPLLEKEFSDIRAVFTFEVN